MPFRLESSPEGRPPLFFAPRVRRIDFDIPPADKFSVQGFNGLIGFRITGHLHKPEALGLIGATVHNHFGLLHLTERGKHGLQIFPGDGEREIANVNIHSPVLSIDAFIGHKRTKKRHFIPEGEEMPLQVP